MRYIFFLFISLASLALAEENFQNLRLVWTENPQSQATIIWESESPTKTDSIDVWEKGGEKIHFSASESKAYTDTFKAYKKKRKKDNSPDAPRKPWYYRHVRISGLKPSTKYYMTAQSDGQKSREFHFITAPNDERTFKLLFVGDSRTHVDVAQKISKNMGEMAKNDPEILAVIHGGDYANIPTLEFWKPWLAAWDLTTGEDGRLLPIIPVVGNHEQIKKSPLYGEAYGLPGGDKNFLYSCKLSPQFRIVVLNSEIPSTGVQEKFLRKTLENYRDEKVKWQLSAFHRPVYPAVKKPSVLKRLIPLFEEFDLDLILESDGHCIKRTVPIKDGKMDPSGVVYLGEGGYGAPQRKTKDTWYLKKPGFTSRGDHLMVLQVNPESINYETIGSDKQLIDSFKFLPKKR